MLADAGAALRAGALGPLQSQQSLAHITQTENEAVNEYDAAVRRVEDHQRSPAKVQKAEAQPPAVKKQRVVKPAELVKRAYLETTADVDAFLVALRKALEAAIAQNERIEIRYSLDIGIVRSPWMIQTAPRDVIPKAIGFWISFA